MVSCARCGYVNQPTSKFCASCGAPVQAPSAQPATAQPPNPPPQQWPPQQDAGWPPAPAAPPAAAPYGPPPGAPPQPPAGWGAPPPGGHQPAPPPPPVAPAPAARGAPQPDPGAFGPARFGSPEGLNPFGATMAPDLSGGSAAAAPFGVPPGPAAPAPVGPPPDLGSAQQSADASAFAATAPPDEEAQRGAYGPPPAPPPAAPSPGPAYGPGPAQPPPAVAPAPAPVPAPYAAAGDKKTLAGFLVSYEGSELGSFWPLYQGRMVIGRKGAASDLDIEVDHPTTSSRHASLEVSARPGRIVLEDLGSTNGTFYGDSKLERGRPIQLRDGDTIRLGGYPVIVKIV